MEGTILIIDDILAEDMVWLIEDMGLKAKGATTFVEAVGLLEKNSFRAIILDLVMPEGEGFNDLVNITGRIRRCPGYELFRMIKGGCFETSGNENIPIIILTGLWGPDYLFRKLEEIMGPRDLIVYKPISTEDVVSMLNNL